MYVVALTGGIGSGKSTAANFFAALGVPVTDVDEISHQLTSANLPIVNDIKASFGSQYITPEGALNRAAMRDLVFNDAAARVKLNSILHPVIYDEALKQLQSHQDAPYQILAIPLLGVIPESEAVLKASNQGTPVILDEEAPCLLYTSDAADD